MAANVICFFELNTGANIPSVGLGTWQAAPEVVACTVTTAINVLHIGLAFKKLSDEGVVKCGELWVTSKLGCSHHAPEDVPVALDKTLKELKVEYIDLYLGSVGLDPENLSQQDIPNTWKAMESLNDSGKARAIGVSNFFIRKLGDILEVVRVPPAANQVELHPTWQQPRGFTTSANRREFTIPSINAEVLKNPVPVSVAEKLGKSPAQIALRWGLQMGHDASSGWMNVIAQKDR